MALAVTDVGTPVTGTLRIVRAVAGWAAAAALVGGAALELRWVHMFGHPTLWHGNSALVLMAFALFRQWSNSGSDRRRAEAYGVLAAATVVYWCGANGLSLLPLHLQGGDWSIPLAASQDAYKIAGAMSLAWALLSLLHRWNDGPPSPDEAFQLRAADKRTLRRTGWVTMTGIVPALVGATLIVTSLGDGLGVIEFGRLLAVKGLEMVVVIVMRGLWLPPLAGGLSLLVRGRWASRPLGALWAVMLLAFAVGAWFTGQSMLDALISA